METLKGIGAMMLGLLLVVAVNVGTILLIGLVLALFFGGLE